MHVLEKFPSLLMAGSDSEHLFACQRSSDLIRLNQVGPPGLHQKSSYITVASWKKKANIDKGGTDVKIHICTYYPFPVVQNMFA